MESDKREYFRVSVGRLTSVIKNSEGNFEVVDDPYIPGNVKVAQSIL